MKLNLSLLLFVGLLSGCEWWFGAEKADDGSDCEEVEPSDLLTLGDRCYRITGSVTIDDGQSVIVGPGADLRFEGDATLRVKSGGQLLASGNGSRPVSFGPAETGGCWGGLVFEPGSAGALEGVIVEGGGFGAGCACAAPAACVSVEPGAMVALNQVGLERCARDGVAGEPSAQEVGCESLGVCGASAAYDCVLGGAGVDWCAEEAVSACWDTPGEEGPKDCEIGERRCAEDKVVQACVGGRWTTITDCSELTNGQTACRELDGFPRCGLPGPKECLALPEQPGGSFIPGCETEGCPAYKAACRGDTEGESCESEQSVLGCLHPSTLVGSVTYAGLGPKWLRMFIYNWGGLPDTTPGRLRVSLVGPTDYELRVWVQPRAQYEREFCGLTASGGSNGAHPGFLAMPPAGEQYEVLVEVGSDKAPSGWMTSGVATVPMSDRWWDQEAVLWRTYNPDSFFPRCNLVSEVVEHRGSSHLSDVCVDSAGSFVDAAGSRVPGFPELSDYPRHADPTLEDCDTWELTFEYEDV